MFRRSFNKVIFENFIFDWQEYSAVGAVIEEDLSEAELIIGVKSVPIDLLLPDKTYAFFSHVIKAQKDNMPLLDAILEKVNSPHTPLPPNKTKTQKKPLKKKITYHRSERKLRTDEKKNIMEKSQVLTIER